MLLKSISCEKSAVIQLERLLIVKSDKEGANIIVKSITDKELELIENNPGLLVHPNELFEALVSSSGRRHIGNAKIKDLQMK